jgi:hypothetical protein
MAMTVCTNGQVLYLSVFHVRSAQSVNAPDGRGPPFVGS